MRILAGGARAAALGLTFPPGQDQRRAARTEGWIAIPEDSSLDRLAQTVKGGK